MCLCAAAKPNEVASPLPVAHAKIISGRLSDTFMILPHTGQIRVKYDSYCTEITLISQSDGLLVDCKYIFVQ